jgi:fructose-1,6-bisphosphatase/inositol monophosphatase family enzyme
MGQVAGMPLSVVSIGVALGNNMEVGVVYNPFNNELFYARRGQGTCHPVLPNSYLGSCLPA